MVARSIATCGLDGAGEQRCHFVACEYQAAVEFLPDKNPRSVLVVGDETIDGLTHHIGQAAPVLGSNSPQSRMLRRCQPQFNAAHSRGGRIAPGAPTPVAVLTH